jgi:hypothetical protein
MTKLYIVSNLDERELEIRIVPDKSKEKVEVYIDNKQPLRVLGKDKIIISFPEKK